MLEKVKAYFEKEYQDEKFLMERKVEWHKPKESIDNTIQRCLGVAMFIQDMGITYEEIEPIYEEYQEKLKKLLDIQ